MSWGIAFAPIKTSGGQTIMVANCARARFRIVAEHQRENLTTARRRILRRFRPMASDYRSRGCFAHRSDLLLEQGNIYFSVRFADEDTRLGSRRCALLFTIHSTGWIYDLGDDTGTSLTGRSFTSPRCSMGLLLTIFRPMNGGPMSRFSSVGEKPPFHSLTRILTNKPRKLGATPFSPREPRSALG